jgi:hypothetical protein
VECGSDALAYDSGSGDGREHMKVVFANGALRDMGKSLPPAEASGENVGIFVLGEAALAALLKQADRLILEGRQNAWVAEALKAAAQEVPVRGVDVQGLPWQEIDFSYDLDRARREVWPAIQAAGRRPGSRRRLIAGATAAVILALLTTGWFLFPRERSWETVPITDVLRRTLHIKGAEHRWWWIEREKTGETRITGPGIFRIDFRPVFPAKTVDERPYVIELAAGPSIRDWHKFTSDPDPEAALPEHVVGDRNHEEIELPAGSHPLTIRLIAGDATGLLVRVRKLERD